MTEYRTERVSPQNENAVIEMLSAFGWVLTSAQEIYNESTDIDGADVKVYGSFMKGFTGNDAKINFNQRKTVTNYIVLKFERDTEMPNYLQLSELNNEFEDKLNIPEPQKPVKRTAVTVIGTVLILISIIMAIVNGTEALLWEILVCVMFPAVTIPITAAGWLKYKRNVTHYDAVLYRINEIYDEAQKLLEDNQKEA